MAAGGLSGCLDFDSMYSSGMVSAADLGTCPERERVGTPRPGQRLDGPVQLFLRNDTNERQRVTVTVERAGRTYVDQQFAVPSGARHSIFKSNDGPPITGKYRITIDIGNGSRLGVDWQVCKHTEELVAIVSSGGGLGFERPE